MAHHPARLRRWIALAALLLVSSTSSVFAQSHDDCTDQLDRIDADPTDDPARRLAEADPVCEAEHRGWLDERVRLDTPTRTWIDASMAAQSSRWAALRATAVGDCVSALEILSEVAHALPDLPREAVDHFARASQAALVCPDPLGPMGEQVQVLGEEVLTLSGVTGGAHDAGLFGMPCAGHVPEVPSHLFEVTAEQRVSLLATAGESGDPTLVLVGPGGTWCDDDTYGLNPALSERLTPGRYAVFVGEASGPGRSTRYQLYIGAQGLPPLFSGTTPRIASLAYPQGGGGGLAYTGRSDGDFAAELLGPDCAGRIGAQPDFNLNLSDHARVTVQARPDGLNDLTLVIAGRDRVVCNDDQLDHDPAVSTWLPPGQYDVWVGRKGELPASYSVRFSEEDLFGVEPGVLTPQFGSATLDGSRRAAMLSGVVTGDELASARFGPYCSGFISFEPSHTVYVEEAATVWIEASPGSASTPGHAGAEFDTGDLTLIVTGSAGTYCSDDSRGRDPGLAERLLPGTYDVYVGERTLSPVGTSYGLRVSLDEPLVAIERPPRSLTLSPGVPTWHGWGRAFGAEPASDVVGEPCDGDLPLRASLQLTLTETADVAVEARAGPLGAPVVALQGPSGRFCGDRSEPYFEARLEAGTHELFVGEAFGTALGTPYALLVAVERPRGTISPSPPPTSVPSVEPLRLDLETDFAMGGAPGVSGGAVPGRLFGASCVGHLPEAPHVIARVIEPGTFRIAVVANGDTTLVVDGPGGPYCNDDTNDYNPVVEAWLDAGEYRIYVGSYSPRLQHEFSMILSRQQAGP